jgi:choline-glycine betaine transporter
MQSNIFTLNWKNVIGAVVSAVLAAVLVYISNLTSLSNFNIQTVEYIAIVVGAVSLLKNLGTDNQGNFAGFVPVR